MERSTNEFKDLNKKYSGKKIEELCSVDLLTFPKNISGPRIYMFSNQLSQAIHVMNPQVPELATGYENAFGSFSDGILKAENNYRIIDKIPRFSNNPDFKYLLVVENLDDGSFDAITVCHYEKLSDMYGYYKPYTKTDKKIIGDIIKKGEVIYKSNNHDDDGNYRYGVNAKCAMMSIAETQEDPVLISKEFADNLKITLIKEVNIPINSNDILLNLFGDDKNYRCLPEIGQDITDVGILCAIRKMVTNQSAFALSWGSLKRTQQSDEIFEAKGKIIDIDIDINKLEEFNGVDDPSNNRSQLLEIYKEELKYHQNIARALSRYTNPKSNIKSSDFLKHIYNRSCNYINNELPNSNIEIKMRSNAGTVAEFAYLTIRVAFETGLFEGCKVTDRYGTKGVIGRILPRENMPRDKFGNVADIVFNATSPFSRANPAQNIELELNFLNESIVRRMKTMTDVDEKIKLMLEFMNDCNKEQGEFMAKKLKSASKSAKAALINEIETSGYMILRQSPLYDTINWETLTDLYHKYDIDVSYGRWKVAYKDIKNKSDRYKTKKQWKSIQNHYKYLWDFDEKTNRPRININTVDKQLKKGKVDLNTVDKSKLYIWQNNHKSFADYLETKKKHEGILDKLSKSVKILRDKNEELSKDEFDSIETFVSYDEETKALLRDYRTPDPLIIANKYIMVLKQVTETGFSAISVGTVNQTGIPIKASKKETGFPYSDTAIACGYMELTNLLRKIEPGIVHRWLASHSTNPEIKYKLIEMLLNKDPLTLHDLPIDDKDIADDVPADSLFAYLFGIGLYSLEDGEKDPFEEYDNFDVDINEYFMKKEKEN